MGRKRIAIPIHSAMLRVQLEKEGTWSEVAKKLGVTRQQIHSWISYGEMPPRRVSDAAKIFNWDVSITRAVLAREKTVGYWKRECERFIKENKRLKKCIAAFAEEEE
jgi:DNA-binding transcriptional MerR regulator